MNRSSANSGTLERIKRLAQTSNPPTRPVLRSLSESLKTVCDDLWLEHVAKVQFLYAVDFQELYNLMYPFWAGDPTRPESDRRKLSREDILASKLFSGTVNRFVLLDGAYLELYYHIQKVQSQLGKVKQLGLRKESWDLIESLAQDLQKRPDQHSSEPLRSGPEFRNALQDVTSVLGAHSSAFGRLETFLASRVVSVPELVPEIKLELDQAVFGEGFRRSIQALAVLRGGPGDEYKNWADALNIAAVLTLNGSLTAAYEAGKSPFHYVIRLFTHTRPIFMVSSAASEPSLDLTLTIHNRIVPLLARPMLLHVHALSREGDVTARVLRELQESRQRVDNALDAYDVLTWILDERRLTLPDLLQGLLASSNDSANLPAVYSAVEHELRCISEAVSDPFVAKVRQQINRYSVVSGWDENLDDRSADNSDIPRNELLAAANKICDRIEMVRTLMMTKTSASAAHRRLVTAQQNNLRYERKGLFQAENLGMRRAKDHVFNKSFSCWEHRLHSAKTDELMFAMDLYSDYFVVSWPTTMDILKFADAVSRLLENTGFRSSESLSTDLEGVIVVDSDGSTSTGPLLFPLRASVAIDDVASPILLRINARNVAFCCEVYNPTCMPLTGVVGAPDAIPFVRELYASVCGTIPDATIATEVGAIQSHFES